MYLKHFIIIGFYLISSITFTWGNSYKKAETILAEVAKIRDSKKAIKGSFLYIFENKKENIQERSKGYFVIKGDNYWVDILGVETFFDGQIISSFLKDANELTIQEPEEDEGLTPSSLFSIYENGFKVRYIGKKAVNEKQMYILDLFPTDESRNYSKVRTLIEQNTYLPFSVETFGKSGDNVRVEILEIDPDAKNITDSTFKFDKKANPKVEIIDMR